MAIPNSFDILQAVIEATPDAIFVKDLEGRYVLVNEAFARFINKSPADIVGRNDFELYPEEDARQFVDADRQVLATGLAQAFEGVATGEAGPQTYLVTKGVYRDNDRKILGVYGISHDITELKHAQETLAQTREALFRSQKMDARSSSSRTKPTFGASCAGSSRVLGTACWSRRPRPKRSCCFRGPAHRICC